MRRIILSLTAAAALAACSADPKPGYIADRFRDGVAQLSISPIYPPREDFYPGDVYISTNNNLDHLQTAIRADSLVEQLGLPAFYAQRPAFAALDDMLYKQMSDQSKVWQQPATPIFATASQDAVRPRLVVFPLYDFAASSSGGLGVNAATSAVGGLLGASGSSDTQMSMSVPAGVQMAVNAYDLRQAFKARCEAQGGTAYMTALRHIGQSLASKDGAKDKVIQLITEVYYAYAIDYEFGATEAFGAELQASITALNKLTAKRQAIADALAALRSGQPTATTGQSTDAATLETQLKEVETQIAEQTHQLAPSLPGVTAAFRSGNASSIQLRQTFQRPVAIGFRRTTYAIGRDCDLKGVYLGAADTADGPTPPAPVAARPAGQ